jgi:hypothetical protein
MIVYILCYTHVPFVVLQKSLYRTQIKRLFKYGWTNQNKIAKYVRKSPLNKSMRHLKYIIALQYNIYI